MRVRFHPSVEYFYDHPSYGSLGSQSHGPRQSRWLRNPSCAQQQRRAIRENGSAYDQARSLVEGFTLSGLFGRPLLTSWPIAWYQDEAWIGVPPADGIVDDEYVGGKRDSFLLVDRGLAVHALRNTWHEYTHWPHS